MSLSQAFARQASSDFDARDVVLGAALPQCHQLHYLQMAMEKAAKAHLLENRSDPDDVQSSHGYTAKVIPIIVRDGLSRIGGKKDGWVMDAVHQFAKKINRLHPGIESQTFPSNCEYPWEDAQGNFIAPADHDFGLKFLNEPAAVKMLKVVKARLMEIMGSES